MKYKVLIYNFPYGLTSENEYRGAIYRITSRGNTSKPIFKDDKNRKAFLELMESITKG